MKAVSLLAVALPLVFLVSKCSSKREVISGRPQHISMALERGMDINSDKWDNRVFIECTLDSGKVFAANVYSENNTTYAIFTSRVLSSSCYTKKDSLFMSFATLTDGAFGNGKFDFYLKGLKRDSVYSGAFITVLDGEDTVSTGPFSGDVADYSLPDPGNASYHLQMYDALDRNGTGKAMWIHMETMDFNFSRGIAYAPRFNHEGYEVEAIDLGLEGSKLMGKVRVRVIPDPYYPENRDTILCVYTLNADIRKDGIKGFFFGNADNTEMEGTITGQLETPFVPGKSQSISLKMEEGVTGGEPWFNRSYFQLSLSGQTVMEGKYSNNKGGWKGKFEKGTWQWDERNFESLLYTTVYEGEVEKGFYSYKLAGYRVGDLLLGDYTAYLRGNPLPTRRFVGTIK